MQNYEIACPKPRTKHLKIFKLSFYERPTHFFKALVSFDEN
jgi:hypothetical protein